MPARLAERLGDIVNPVQRLDARPFDRATPFGPPHGRYVSVHYGVMVPGLAAPHRFLDVIAVIGQPRIPIWRNDHLVRTNDRDTVSLLTATGAMTAGQLVGYSAAADCEFAADGSRLRFGDRLTIEGSYPAFVVGIDHPEVSAELRLAATDVVTHFARLRGGRYDHWSLLCRYEGQVGDEPAAGLCTLEYARGTGIRLPLRLFTYSILNVDDRTQVLMGQVLGPAGLPVQGVVHVRSADQGTRAYRHGFDFSVQAYEDEPRTTPDGRQMRLPREFTWRVEDQDGAEVAQVEGSTCGDFTYGMAAGYAGSYRYSGLLLGRPISGVGYLEYIDGR